jgi:para-nitrobenzyl esterase
MHAISALAIVGLAVGFCAPASADPPTAETAQGKIHGKLLNDGKVKAFLGLPYAAPPVGELRWKAPQPAAHWKGVREATSFGAHCAQNAVFDDMPLPECLRAR